MGRRCSRGRIWFLLAGAVGAAVLVLVVTLVSLRTSGQHRSGSMATREPLTWAPPPCGDRSHKCIDVWLEDTGRNQTVVMESDDDYRVHLPKDRPLRGGLQLRNAGRNVIIIGGQIDLTVPCSDDTSDCHGIMISKQLGGGQVFIEGVWIHNATPIPATCAVTDMPCSTGDGIDDDDDPLQPTDVTLQNVRIDGISGCSATSAADHADVFQPYDAPDANLRIDHLTGITNCQGMHLDPELAYQRYGKFAKSIVLKDVNVNVLRNPYSGNANRYVVWLTYHVQCQSGPVRLDDVYVDEPDHTLRHAAWPDTNQPPSCRSAWAPETGTLSFPRSPQIDGVLHAGRPPAGDFVPAARVGLHYVSPGYR